MRNKKNDNGLYGGILLLLIGFLMLVAEVGTTFPILLLIAGGILLVVSLILAFTLNENQPKQNKKVNTTRNQNGKVDITEFVYQESCAAYMDFLKDIAEDLGKIEKYNKYYSKLEQEIKNLQFEYGYSLQGQSKHITALAYYYLFDAEQYIFVWTRKPTTRKEYLDIIDIIINNLDDTLVEEDPDFFIRDIVEGYFFWGNVNSENDEKDYTVRYIIDTTKKHKDNENSER